MEEIVHRAPSVEEIVHRVPLVCIRRKGTQRQPCLRVSVPAGVNLSLNQPLTRETSCLPMDYEGRNGTVAIPRSLHRSRLANQETGLFGKFQFNLDWSPERMQREISSLFSKPFGLTEEDLAAGKTFKFDYLQRTGAGSRTLCVPSVTQYFQWNGRQVATLAKSGGVIYVLAKRRFQW